MRRSLLLAVLGLPFFICSARAADTPVVTLLRVPNAGIEPQAAMDDRGTLHVIYFRGDPAHGDLFYVRSSDGGAAFSTPIRINSQAGSAVATGSVRGAHLAIGKNNRLHVAWMGSNLAEPKARGDGTPMLYARLNDAATAFEPQRNVIRLHPGLDGGGSVAADAQGNVYAAWHAPTEPKTGEANRRVWVATSTDDGRTFAAETAATDQPTGACGCCGMALFADPAGRVFAIYRSATEMVNRDTYLLASNDQGKSFKNNKISPMHAALCIMSTPALAPGGAADRVLAAWETQGQVFWSAVDSTTLQPGAQVAAPGRGGKRKYPALAGNAAGEVLLAWTEGMGWQKGGSLAWQVFDKAGNPVPGRAGTAPGVPMWDTPAAFARADGSFAIIY